MCVLSLLLFGEACMWCQKRPNVVSKETSCSMRVLLRFGEACMCVLVTAGPIIQLCAARGNLSDNAAADAW